MADGEGVAVSPFSENAPIPDRIMVEDEEAAELYESVGYKNVEIMEKVFRYEHLDVLQLERRVDTVLIAPGLHDGSMMLEHLLDEIEHNPETTYYLKPHPRADNNYAGRYSKLSNVKVVDQSIPKLLTQISRVIVTYSSVGLEASRLGLPVTVMSIPGRVNTSPLLNSKNYSDRD
jgi:capsule polysaccharide export protein KpsC/LpsZ